MEHHSSDHLGDAEGADGPERRDTGCPSFHVVIVHDHPGEGELIAETLRRAGLGPSLDVLESAESLDYRLMDCDFNLMICAHALRNGTGLDVLERLNGLGKQIPFIVVAALDDETAVEYIKRGAADYVRKDRLDRLSLAVAEVLREHPPQKDAARYQQLLRAKREWELTFDTVPDPVLVLDERCKVRRANRAASEMLGLPFRQLIGRPCYEVVPGSCKPHGSCPHQRLLTTGRVERSDIEETRLGKIFDSTVAPLRGPAGAIRGCVHVLRDVTERRRAEQALRASEERFESVFRSSPDAIAVATLSEGRFVDVNEKFYQLTGYKRDEVLGQTGFELGLWGDPDECASVLSLIRERGRIEEYEHTWKIRSGEVQTILSSGERIEWAGQECLVAVIHDITHRRRAQNALRESEEKFRLLLDSTAEAIFGLDLDGNCTFCNAACVRILGYKRPEDLLGKNIHSLIHHSRANGEAYPEAECPGHIALHENRGIHVQDELLWRADGTSFPAEFWSYPIEKEGTVVGSVVAFLDITERKRAEKALQESEEKYRQIVENASFGIFQSTFDGKLLDVNPAFVAMLGYESKEDVLRLNVETDIYQNASDRRQIIRGYGADRKRVAAETVLKRKDGGLIQVRINGRVVHGQDGQVRWYEVMVDDVTEQKNLEEQFRQSQKMEAVGRLAGGIAHDFNNVLMIVNSYAELIMGRQMPDPTVQRYTEHIIQAARKATSLTSQLLAFSRKQILQPTTLDLHAVVCDIGKMLPPMLGEDIEMTIVSAPDLRKVHADRAQIEQVLMNLAVNARDAMPNGGKLLIELQNVTVDRSYTRRRAAIPPGSYVAMAFSDTGVGMDAATQAKIFEPFFTTKGVGKGTGLGLSTVYGIVKQSGGYIWVYSEPGVGTTFKIYLPQMEGESNAPALPEPQVGEYPSNGTTVLLVDDEADLRAAAREFLEEAGYRVLEAESGAGALGVCTAYREPIAVLVTDLIMPGMRGTELAAKISRLHPDIKTLYMSGYTDCSKDIEALGPDAIFLQKPFSLKMLAQKLHMAVQREKTAGALPVQADG